MLGVHRLGIVSFVMVIEISERGGLGSLSLIRLSMKKTGASPLPTFHSCLQPLIQDQEGIANGRLALHPSIRSLLPAWTVLKERPEERSWMNHVLGH
jgi:hypothetical protein